MSDWRASIEAALALEPNHISAYSLIVEEGTAFARKVRRGEVVMPDDDETAEKYLLADSMFEAAGLGWYEVSNWARDEAAQCRHNVLYWHSADWWGIGPGAHSHVGGERWWNVKHPAAYADRLVRGQSPRADGEVLDSTTRHLEDVMLRLRLREGIALGQLAGDVAAVVADGFGFCENGRLVLTAEGRLMADHVIRALT
jgi:coproporphyrinogen III oxidase-like Fe-S oxidoreductase